MDNNIQRGQLKRWNDDKGFGFIKPDSDSSDVFMHISAVKKDLSRRPKVGDTVFYNVKAGKDGKKQAYNVRIDGVSYVLNPPISQSTTHKKRRNNNWFLSGLSIIGLSLLLYMFMFMRTDLSDIYSCTGKKYCSEMSSCAEAKFYLKNCPGTQLDGDNDRTPCERQLCSW